MVRTSQIYQEEIIPSPQQQLWRNYASSPVAMLGLWVFGIFVFISIFAPLLAPYPQGYQHTSALLMAPSWHPTGHVAFFFGTDDLGRDILSNLIYGTRTTFGASLIVTFIALCFGCLIGIFSGMTHGLKSSVLNHIFDATLAIPSLLLAIVFVAISGPGMINVMLAVGISLTPQFMRATHNAVHNELSKEYVTATKLDGANKFQIFFHSILPNILDALVIQITLAISIAIIDIATLGFLKLGVQSPRSEWGAMLSEGLDLIFLAPWNVAFPGLMIFASVLSINIIGSGLQRALKERID